MQIFTCKSLCKCNFQVSITCISAIDKSILTLVNVFFYSFLAFLIT